MVLPALCAPDPGTAERVFEFFAAKIRSKNTRRAYAPATGGFAAWCEGRGLQDLAMVRTLHVAACVEKLSKTPSAPSVKLNLAAIRMLFDHLVVVPETELSMQPTRLCFSVSDGAGLAQSGTATRATA